FDVRAVASDAKRDVLTDRERVHSARVYLADRGHELLEARLVAPVAVAEVEAAQPLDAPLLARGDAVEVVLHARGELVVDEPAEVLLEQLDDGEREEG